MFPCFKRIVCLFLTCSTVFAAAPSVSVGIRLSENLKSEPCVLFGAADLTRALKETGCSIAEKNAELEIRIELFRPGLGPQAFRIRKEGKHRIAVIGGDALGAMYGTLELAEMIMLSGGLDGIRDKACKPSILRRGLKFNIPMDARGHSYDDTGTAAQKNIPVMWDFAFWKTFLDTMARDRYNVLTLWTTHPYPGFVKLEQYPGIGYDDVCVLKEPVTPRTDRHWNTLDVYDPDNFKVVRKISLTEKIAFWRRVFDLAEARGIELYFFHWNIFTFGAKGKYGINDMPDNPKTIEYLRYAIAQFLKTYPQIDGIGVTAGEHVNRKAAEKIGGIEEFLFRTYGRAVMDVKRDQPDRELRFIFRQHQARLGKIVKAFDTFTAPFHTGHKYARARLYSTTTSPYLDFEYRSDLEKNKVPCWLNLRNDDLYILRWGDPDYVREFLQNVPRDLMRYEAGYYMGPDGYIWGRDFVSKDPAFAGMVEMRKHWYRFMLWGRLGYDLTLTRDYFENRLKHHFPKTDPALLYDIWKTASQIVPLVNRFFFRVNDFQFSPEGCISNRGFLTIDDSFFKYPPLKGSGILSVQEYAQAVVDDVPFEGITPYEVAADLDRFAVQTLEGVKSLTADRIGSELSATCGDMKAAAYLGRYYADKIRGAAAVAVFRADPAGKKYHEKAVKHLEDAVDEWKRYAETATAVYLPQLYARTHYMDWMKILEDVKREVETVRREGERS